MLSDLNTNSPDDPDDGVPDAAPPGHRPSTAFLLIDALLDKALVPPVFRRLLRAGTSAIILVPDPSWVGKMITSINARFTDAHVRSIFERPKRPADAIDLERPFSAGQTTIVVTPDLGFVPAPIRATCDLIVRLDGPDARQVRRAIRAVTGQVARGLTEGDVAGRSLDELIAAIRPNSSAADCVARLKPRIDVNQLVSGPDLATLPLFGDAKTWADEIAISARRLLGGEIAAKDIEGTLLYGPPGTGKTILAAAVARSAGMGFVQTSAAEWFLTSDGNLGGVLKAADSFFQTLVAAAPAVGLIDELDAFPDRATLSPDRREWWQSLVTGLLLMISRTLGSERKIILIGATNHPNHIDAALKRPGRFGRHVHVRAAQTEAEIAAILSYHLAGALDATAIAEIAAVSGLPTAAEIEGWVRAARTLAFTAGRSLIASDILEQIAPKDARSDDDLRLVAIHEAGHAIAVVALGFQLRRVTIAGNETIGGVTSWRGPDIATLALLERQVLVKLGGRAADIAVGRGANDGACTDLENATKLLVAAETSFGLRESLVSRPGDLQLLSMDRLLLLRVEQHLDRLMGEALALIRSRRAEVLAVAEALLVRRVLSGEAVQKIITEVATALPQSPEEPALGHAEADGALDTSPPLKT